MTKLDFEIYNVILRLANGTGTTLNFAHVCSHTEQAYPDAYLRLLRLEKSGLIVLERRGHGRPIIMRISQLIFQEMKP
jgi:hypothetical protein